MRLRKEKKSPRSVAPCGNPKSSIKPNTSRGSQRLIHAEANKPSKMHKKVVPNTTMCMRLNPEVSVSMYEDERPNPISEKRGSRRLQVNSQGEMALTDNDSAVWLIIWFSFGLNDLGTEDVSQGCESCREFPICSIFHS